MILEADPWTAVRERPIAQCLLAEQRLGEDTVDDAFLAEMMQEQRKGVPLPMPEYLHSILREKFLALDDDDYSELFDTAELFFSLITMDLRQDGQYTQPWFGAFISRDGLYARTETETFWGHFLNEAVESGESWGPLAAGLFDGSAERVTAASNAIRPEIVKLQQHYRFP